MKALKRWVIVLLVLVVLGGALELALRAFVPSLIEGGARVALRVPQGGDVTAETHGSMLLNAMRGRISDVVVTAEGVPLTDEVTATATLEVGSMPLIPTFGKLRDGTATFEVSAEQLDAMVGVVSRGLASWGEMREGALVAGGVLSDQQFDLPQSPAFEIPYEIGVELGVEEGDVLVTPSSVWVQDEGPIGEFLTGAMGEARTVCLADRLPAGVTLTGAEVRPTGEMVLRADLSEGLLSDFQERQRGTCT